MSLLQTNATDELEGKVYCLSDHMVNNVSESYSTTVFVRHFRCTMIH